MVSLWCIRAETRHVVSPLIIATFLRAKVSMQVPTLAMILLVMVSAMSAACTNSSTSNSPTVDAAEDISSDVAMSSDVTPDVEVDSMPEPSPPTLERISALPAGVHGFTVDASGVFYIADTFSNAAAQSRLYRLAPPYDGALSDTGIVGQQLAGLDILDGQLVVCDIGANTVEFFNLDTLASTQTLNATQPWNVARVGGDLLTVSFANTVERILPDQAPTTLIDGLQSPFDVVGDPDQSDHVWVSEQQGTRTPRVALWSLRDGTLSRQLNLTWNNPEGLALGPQGLLWVADTGGQMLHAFEPASGTLRWSLATDGLPIILATDPAQQTLYVTTTGTNPALWRVVLSAESSE